MDTAHGISMLDYVAAAILERDAEGRVRSANAAAQRLFYGFCRRADAAASRHALPPRCERCHEYYENLDAVRRSDLALRYSAVRRGGRLNLSAIC